MSWLQLEWQSQQHQSVRRSGGEQHAAMTAVAALRVTIVHVFC
jgi:hypothetical protein